MTDGRTERPDEVHQMVVGRRERSLHVASGIIDCVAGPLDAARPVIPRLCIGVLFEGLAGGDRLREDAIRHLGQPKAGTPVPPCCGERP